MELYEKLFRRVLFPAYESGLRRRRTLRYLADYEATQWLPTERIEALQWEQLKRLIRHCWENVPYYRDRWRAAGATPEDIRGMADFARLPTLSKTEIRANFDALVSTAHRSRLLTKTTGGSTGEPLRIGYDHDSYERRIAVMWRGYGWSGMRLGARTAWLWGTPLGTVGRFGLAKSAVFDRLMNRRMHDAFAMQQANLRQYADRMASQEPHYVVGYVRPLFELARWMNSTGFARLRPKAVITGAEALRAHERAEIEAAFGCRVFDTYGCREMMLIASECERHDGLHVNADQLVVEIEAPDADTGIGEVLLTDLHNYAMPLLRYRNGDLAAAHSGGACGCGRGLPRLRCVDGRTLDALLTRDGRIVPGEFFPHLLKDYAEIRQFQVVQSRIEDLQLRYVAEQPLPDSRQDEIRTEVRAVFGPAIEVRFERVDAISASPSGKRRVTVNLMGAGEPRLGAGGAR